MLETYFLKKDLLFILERERESRQVGGGVEGEDLQVDSLLSMEPEVGLDFTTNEIMTRAKIKS